MRERAHGVGGGEQLGGDGLGLVGQARERGCIPGLQMRPIGCELFTQPRDCPGRLDRSRRHPLLNELEHRRGACLAGTLVPGAPDRSRGEDGGQHEDPESGVEQAHAAEACGR